MTVRLHPVWRLVLVASFLAGIVAPGAAMFLDLDAGAGLSRDDRSLAAEPVLEADWPALRALPADASKYFDDHFAFRSRLVRWQAALRLWGLETSPSSDVIVGKEGWLYYAGDGGLDDLTSVRPFSPRDLEHWRLTLEHTDAWLRRRGIRYLFVIVPDKHVVYPEYLPASIHPVGQSRTEQLLQYLRDHSAVQVLDLRPALAEAKRRERVYHLTDTHWNDRGAFAGYQAIVEALGPAAAGAPLSRDLWSARSVTTGGWDLADMLGLADAMPEVNLTLEPRAPSLARVVEPANPNRYGEDVRIVSVHSNHRLPRAVVFRDSFGSALVPFLSQLFSRTLFLWQPNMAPAVIEAEHPQVVIQEWAGRHLTTLVPYDGVVSQQ